MIISAKSGKRGVLVNTDTGERIPLARWANTETGEYERFATLDGKTILRDGDNRPLVNRGKARLKFIESGTIINPGKESLTPEQEKEEIRTIAKDYVKDYQEITPTPGIECDEPMCHRLAQWEVAHEQEIDPGVNTTGNPCERAVTVETGRFCSEHWRPPTITTLRGITKEQVVNVRPLW